MTRLSETIGGKRKWVCDHVIFKDRTKVFKELERVGFKKVKNFMMLKKGKWHDNPKLNHSIIYLANSSIFDTSRYS